MAGVYHLESESQVPTIRKMNILMLFLFNALAPWAGVFLPGPLGPERRAAALSRDLLK